MSWPDAEIVVIPGELIYSLGRALVARRFLTAIVKPTTQASLSKLEEFSSGGAQATLPPTRCSHWWDCIVRMQSQNDGVAAGVFDRTSTHAAAPDALPIASPLALSKTECAGRGDASPRAAARKFACRPRCIRVYEPPSAKPNQDR